MATDLLYGLLPEQLLLGLILVLMLLDMFRFDRRLGSLLVSATLAGGCVVLVRQLGQGYGVVVVPGEVVVDRFGLLARLLVLGCGLVLGLCDRNREGSFKERILLASSLLGALIIMDSAGFASLFMGIEMLSLPAFSLMVCACGSGRASEGAFKYLLLSSVASALILFGISLAYYGTGSLAIADFAALLPRGGVESLAAIILLLSGFFLKAAVFPFHAWAPDAYGGARLHTTSFLASVIKGAVVLGLVRILSSLALGSELVTALVVLSLASILYGNIGAIRQTAFRRLLAYSSIAHAGYMMFALADTTGGRVEALLYYVSVYAVTTIIACACFGLIQNGEDDGLDVLSGAFARRPVPAVVLALCVLSMAGIPPLPGFFAKLFVFRSVIASGHLLPSILAFVGSYLGTIFYLGVVLRLFAADQEPCCRGGGEDERMAWVGIFMGGLLLGLFMVVPGVFHRLLV